LTTGGKGLVSLLDQKGLIRRDAMNDTVHITGKGLKIGVGVAVLLWLATVLVLGTAGAFSLGPGVFPLPIVVGLLTPIVVFLIALWAFGPFRDLVMSIDLQVAAGIQAWRFAGLGFIALYTYGVLPGLFAWSAGLGDIAIGVTAPLVVYALRRRPAFAVSGLYWVWNLFGMLDLVNAVSLGALSAVLGLGLSSAITTFPMGAMPLVLIPAFLVPMFFMLHTVSLVQARRLATAGKDVCSWPEPTFRCEPLSAPLGA
jgi:hypothetical protein